MPQILIASSAVLSFIIGALHLRATLFSSKLDPRDPDLAASMKNTSVMFTDKLLIWDAWVGFNASQSLGLLLFGTIYGYLSIFRITLLYESQFMLWAGGLYLCGLVLVAKKYFFIIPMAAFGVCLALYVVGAGGIVF
ncbi:hypothetical protein G4G27_00125 [Sphingomonas sp. So64.6b]|uniref:LIC_13387 family protein n=1 Tax=Sphingomonas sp. So64.6b TaxID=2997354 RepID=UPI0016009991|nr:hypothetical protein [Sphingomonas sp. So64.6b]QNA82594.1 hypothetical protein G4G27_00125 [Sphingomonas sp. So64.6b]